MTFVKIQTLDAVVAATETMGTIMFFVLNLPSSLEHLGTLMARIFEWFADVIWALHLV